MCGVRRAARHGVAPAQPDRNADRSLEERHWPQTPIPRFLQEITEIQL